MADSLVQELLDVQRNEDVDGVRKVLHPWFQQTAQDPQPARTLLKKLKGLRQPQLAAAVLRSMLEARLQADGYHFGAVVSAYREAGNMVKAMELLQSMAARNIHVDVVACTPIIRACSKSGEWTQALDLLNIMVLSNAKLDTIACTAAINACAQGGEWTQALGLLHVMAESRLERNHFSYTAGVSACDKAGEWRKALALLLAAQATAVEADVVMYTSVISACNRGGRWNRALELLSLMARDSVQKSVVTCNAVISACEKAGEWRQALDLLSIMAESKVQADAITYNAAISACDKGKEWERSLELLSTIFTSAIKASEITYNAAISACDKASKWTEAFDLMRAMVDNGVQLSDVTYCAVISSCARSSRWQHALCLYNGLGLLTSSPQGIILGSVVSACCFATAWSVASSMLDIEVSKWLEAENLCRRGEQGPSLLAFSQTSGEAGHAQIAGMRVLLQGPGVIAVAKPPSLPSDVAIRHVQSELHENGRLVDLTCISRLDAHTSGALVIAIGGIESASANFLLAQFASRLVVKTYHCLSSGGPLGASGSAGIASASLRVLTKDGGSLVQVSQQGAEARTLLRVVACYALHRSQPQARHPASSFSVLSLLAVRPITGRTHQIRSHLASLGRPLVGDTTYAFECAGSDLEWCPRLFLHCSRVSLRDVDGTTCSARAPLAADLTAAMRHLCQIDSCLGI